LLAVLALSVACFRRPMLDALGRNRGFLVITSLAAGAALLPLALQYHAVAQQSGMRPYVQVAGMLPRVQSWFYMGQGNWVYGQLVTADAFRTLPFNGEHVAGVGFVTLAAAIIGLNRSRQRPAVALSMAGLAATVLVTTAYTDWVVDPVTAWRLVFDYVPGAQAIRAVTRISILVTIPVAIGVAHFLARQNTPRLAFLVLVPLIVLEQGHSTGVYEKEEARARIRTIAERVAPSCSSFYYAPDHTARADGGGAAPIVHLDAMWAALLVGIPTVNGYSGNEPPGYDRLGRSIVRSEDDSAELNRALHHWASSQGIPLPCVVS
jgi:hypothetical protein